MTWPLMVYLGGFVSGFITCLGGFICGALWINTARLRERKPRNDDHLRADRRAEHPRQGRNHFIP
jgi:hypothetical protein